MSDFTIERANDRFLVRTTEGIFSAVVRRRGGETLVSYRGRVYTIGEKRKAKSDIAAAGDGTLRAPIPGVVVDVRVRAGETVDEGQTLLVVEAMKTQTPYLAPFAGTVAELPVAAGQSVAEDALLVRVERA